MEVRFSPVAASVFGSVSAVKTSKGQAEETLKKEGTSKVTNWRKQPTPWGQQHGKKESLKPRLASKQGGRFSCKYAVAVLYYNPSCPEGEGNCCLGRGVSMTCQWPHPGPCAISCGSFSMIHSPLSRLTPLVLCRHIPALAVYWSMWFQYKQISIIST